MIIKRYLPILLSLIALIAIFTLTTGCSSDGDDDVYAVDIYLDGSLGKSVTMDELLALEQISFTADNKDEEGPTLLSVLELAGIEDFSELTAYGLSKGRIAEAEITLSRNQVHDEVILDITNRGTSKLAASDIPSDDWIIDVEEIKVK